MICYLPQTVSLHPKVIECVIKEAQDAIPFNFWGFFFCIDGVPAQAPIFHSVRQHNIRKYNFLFCVLHFTGKPLNPSKKQRKTNQAEIPE